MKDITECNFCGMGWPHLASCPILLQRTCLWDESLALYRVGGEWVCERHARCARCGALLHETLAPLFCVCADYGSWGHENKAWCSMECMEGSHEAGEFADQEQEEG